MSDPAKEPRPSAPGRSAGAHPALRPAASTILVCNDGVLKLLWVRRSEANPFLGGFHSFPGGRLAREDGALGASEAADLVTMARCAAREAFEETGLLVGFEGTPPGAEEQRRLRAAVLDGKSEFWPVAEGDWGLRFDAARYLPCGRWITPHFSKARFNTNFFFIEMDRPEAPDVWPGELESGAWVDPREALRLWEEDRIVLAMPTLHTIRVLAEGGHGLPARLHAIPEANGVPSRYVEVRPAITMLPLRSETIPPATHTNAVVVGDGDVVIVDPGSTDPEEQDALDGVVRSAMGPRGRVAAILLTHHHRDHVAGVPAARARYGAPVWAHAEAAAHFPIERALAEGEAIDLPGRHPRRLRVLEAPGHARSHLVFYEETSRTLIAGDVVSGLGTVVIAPPDGDMAAYVATLERLRGLHALGIIPGHGAPQRGAERMLAATLQHRRMREGRILDALASGPLALDPLRARVYEDTPDADPTLSGLSLRAHLAKLEAEGRVARDGDLARLL